MQKTAFERLISDWSSDVFASDLLSLEKFGDALHDFPAFTASVCNLQPSSRGHVHITSANPREAPAILCNYLHTEQDRQVAADSIRLTRKIVGQKALSTKQQLGRDSGRDVVCQND